MTTTNKWRLAAAHVVVIGLFLWHARVVHYVEDDAFISYRYAQHFAQGQGLVYNLGERVEGYSNFLWVVTLAGASRLWPSAALPTLGHLGTLVAGVVVLLLLFNARFDERWSATGLVAGTLMAAHSGFVAWSGSGLETVPFAALVLAGAIAFGRYLDGRWSLRPAALCFALAALMRADGVLFAAATFLAAVGVERRRKTGRAGVRRLVEYAGIVGAIYLPYLVWRYSYYGTFVPNTAAAKVGEGADQFIRGLGYVRSYVVDYSVWLWAPVVAVYLVHAPAWARYVVWLIGVTLAYVVWVGGDSLGFHRFLVQVAPLMALVVAAALVDTYARVVASRLPRTLAIATAVVVLTLIAALTARSSLVPVFAPGAARWTEPQSELSFPGDGVEHEYTWFNNYFVERLTVAATYLQTVAPAGAVVAATPAGAIAYYMDHPVIDMLGLTDRHIAQTTDVYRDATWTRGRAGHEKGDGAYVLSRAPEFILLGNVAVLPYPLDDARMAEKLVFKSEHELWASAAFHEQYVLVSVRLHERGPFQYFSFYRRRH